MEIKKWTEAELKCMTRLDIRRIAVQALGIEMKFLRDSSTDALIAQILEAQNSEKKEEETPKDTKRGKKSETIKEVVNEDLKQASDSSGILMAIGKEIDKNQITLLERFNTVDRNLQFLFSLVCKLSMIQLTQDELNEILQEVESEISGNPS